ncbi:hypothetical protein ACIBF5_29745 [Micromonospora sp. NPDC050417]|uniref:hypothetical protein n=1 Tax=Micromonospora sp. NPDC050417 TaxID=3364280 RepID=UPI0037B06C88
MSQQHIAPGGAAVRRNDRLIIELPPNPPPMLVEVVRVATDNSWADLRVHWLGGVMQCRRPLPLPEGVYTPYEWTDSDVQSGGSYGELPDSSDEFGPWTNNSSDESADSSDEFGPAARTATRNT